MGSTGIIEALASQDAMFRLTVIIGVTVAVLTCVLLGAIILLRMQVRLSERRHRLVVERWRPVIVSSVFETPMTVPKVMKTTAPDIMHLWNYYHESTRGEEARAGLNAVARMAGFGDVARTYLAGRSFRLRVLGVVTLGRMRMRSVWFELVDIVRSDTVFMSLVAARSLIQIDPAVAMEVIVPMINERSDWPLDRLSALMRQAGSRVITEPLVNLAEYAAGDALVTAVRLFEYCEPGGTEGITRSILRDADSPQLTAACLRVLRNPLSLPMVRPFLSHPLWFIRVHAVRAVGRFGVEEDLPRLIELLSDPEWWVRYRTAQAIVGLPFMDDTRLAAVIAALDDRYARDIMQQVMFERGEGA